MRDWKDEVWCTGRRGSIHRIFFDSRDQLTPIDKVRSHHVMQLKIWSITWVVIRKCKIMKYVLHCLPPLLRHHWACSSLRLSLFRQFAFEWNYNTSKKNSFNNCNQVETVLAPAVNMFYGWKVRLGIFAVSINVIHHPPSKSLWTNNMSQIIVFSVGNRNNTKIGWNAFKHIRWNILVQPIQ